MLFTIHGVVMVLLLCLGRWIASGWVSGCRKRFWVHFSKFPLKRPNFVLIRTWNALDFKLEESIKNRRNSKFGNIRVVVRPHLWRQVHSDFLESFDFGSKFPVRQPRWIESRRIDGLWGAPVAITSVGEKSCVGSFATYYHFAQNTSVEISTRLFYTWNHAKSQSRF